VVTAAILLRPTQSLALHLQQIGRVLRVHDGKQNAVIIDHAGNLHRHGAAEDARVWSLDGRPKKKGKSEAVMKDCPWCFCCVHLACATCPECGHDFEVKTRKIEQVEGNLVEYKSSGDNVAELMAKAKTLADFQRIAKMKGYKPGWAWHQTKKPKFSYNL
jgi:superfamily II DNA or RNA helicase